MSGVIRAGIGGWTFEPWRGVFYPKGLKQAEELSYASRQLSAIEINSIVTHRAVAISGHCEDSAQLLRSANEHRIYTGRRLFHRGLR